MTNTATNDWTGGDIVNEAWREFEAWVQKHYDEVGEFDLLEQIDAYAKTHGVMI